MAIDGQSIIDGIVTFSVLFAIAFMAYTAIKKQTLRDTWKEIVSLFSSPAETAEEMVPF